MSSRRMAMAIALASSAVLAVGGPSLAGSAWTAPATLRTAPTGVAVDVGDIAGAGDAVVVGWKETPTSGAENVRMRWSTDRGGTWSSTLRPDTRPQREIQVDVCSSFAWAVSGLRIDASPLTWALALDGHDLVSSEYESGILTTSGIARKPDIACAGTKRLAVAWFASSPGGYRVKLYSRGVLLDLLGENPPEIRRDLGPGAVKKGLAVAASASRIYVAWFAGTALKLKRYDVGAAPRYRLTERPTQTIATGLTYGLSPKLAVAGNRVVLAYTNRASLVARRSADGGATWSSARTLISEPFPSEVIAVATNADMTGSRAIVSGYEFAGDPGGPSGTGFLLESLDAGATWPRPISQTPGGRAVGAFVGSGPTSRAVEAWDEAIADPPVQHLFFHRQS